MPLRRFSRAVAHIRLRLRGVRLRQLLPGKRTLLTRLLDLLALRRALRRWKPAQFAGLVSTQGTLGALLVTCRVQRVT